MEDDEDEYAEALYEELDHLTEQLETVKQERAKCKVLVECLIDEQTNLKLQIEQRRKRDETAQKLVIVKEENKRKSAEKVQAIAELANVVQKYRDLRQRYGRADTSTNGNRTLPIEEKYHIGVGPLNLEASEEDESASNSGAADILKSMISKTSEASGDPLEALNSSLTSIDFVPESPKSRVLLEAPITPKSPRRRSRAKSDPAPNLDVSQTSLDLLASLNTEKCSDEVKTPETGLKPSLRRGQYSQDTLMASLTSFASASSQESKVGEDTTSPRLKRTLSGRGRIASSAGKLGTSLSSMSQYASSDDSAEPRPRRRSLSRTPTSRRGTPSSTSSRVRRKRMKDSEKTSIMETLGASLSSIGMLDDVDGEEATKTDASKTDKELCARHSDHQPTTVPATKLRRCRSMDAPDARKPPLIRNRRRSKGSFSNGGQKQDHRKDDIRPLAVNLKVPIESTEKKEKIGDHNKIGEGSLSKLLDGDAKNGQTKVNISENDREGSGHKIPSIESNSNSSLLLFTDDNDSVSEHTDIYSTITFQPKGILQTNT